MASDPSSFSLPPEDRARMLAAMAGAIDGGFWTSPDGNSGGSPGEIAAAMLCALEPLLAEREAAAREEGAEDALARWQQAGLALNASRAEARGLREALEGLRDLRAISFISTQHALDSYVDAVQRRVDAALSASPDTETRGAGLLDIADEVKEVATSLTHVPGLEPEVLDDHVTDLLVIAGRLREPSRPVSVPEQEEGCCVAARGSHPPDCPCECHRAASSSSSEEGERVPARCVCITHSGGVMPVGPSPGCAVHDPPVPSLRERLTSDEALRERVKGAIFAEVDEHLLFNVNPRGENNRG